MGHKGPNYSGHDHVCGACQARCPQFMPDNLTTVPICSACWGKLTIVQRMMILAEMKQAQNIGIIGDTLTEILRSGDLLQSRSRKNEGN